MVETPRAALAIAPLWKRAFAVLIDLAFELSAIAVIAGPLIVIAECTEWGRKRIELWQARSREKQKARPAPPRVDPARLAVGVVMAVERRNRPTNGQVLLGISRVDATNGGPVKVTSAIVYYLTRELISISIARAAFGAQQRWRDQLNALGPELLDLKHRALEHPNAVGRELTDLLRTHKINPVPPQAASVVGQLAALYGTAMLLPNSQSLPDFAAGIATTSNCRPGSGITRSR